MTGPPVAPVVIRPPLAQSVAAVAGGVAWLVALAILARRNGGGSEIAAVLIGLFVVVLVIRVARLEVRGNAGELLVRNRFRTYRLKWAEVSTIEPRLAGGIGPQEALYVVRSSGRPVRVDATRPALLGNRRARLDRQAAAFRTFLRA